LTLAAPRTILTGLANNAGISEHAAKVHHPNCGWQKKTPKVSRTELTKKHNSPQKISTPSNFLPNDAFPKCELVDKHYQIGPPSPPLGWA